MWNSYVNSAHNGGRFVVEFVYEFYMYTLQIDSTEEVSTWPAGGGSRRPSHRHPGTCSMQSLLYEIVIHMQHLQMEESVCKIIMCVCIYECMYSYDAMIYVVRRWYSNSGLKVTSSSGSVSQRVTSRETETETETNRERERERERERKRENHLAACSGRAAATFCPRRESAPQAPAADGSTHRACLR